MIAENYNSEVLTEQRHRRRFCGICSEVVANVTDPSNFYVSRPVNVSDMLLHRQVAGKCNTKIFCLGGKGNIGAQLEVNLEHMFYFMHRVKIQFYQYRA